MDSELSEVVTGGRPQLGRRRRVLAGVVVGAVLFAAGGVAASFAVKSPQQAAADAAAPEADVLTASVEKRVLTNPVVVRGTVAAGQSVDVTPSGTSGEGGLSLVSKLPVQVGDKVKAGQVVAEVSGRPVIALKGKIPAYRDLKPGTEGDDVAQLQQALKALGFGRGYDTAGTFGAGTQSALADFYDSIGYEPTPAQDGGEEAVESAEGVVKQAKRSLEDAKTAAASDDSTSAKTQVTRAEEDLADAQKKLAEAGINAGPMLPASEVVYLTDFPARVDAVLATVGKAVSGTLLKLSTGALIVQGSLQAYEKDLLSKGQKVDILSELTGDEAKGTVASVTAAQAGSSASSASSGGGSSNSSSSSGGTGTTSGGWTVTVTPDEALPASLMGQDVRLTVSAASTKGKVLVVPVAAVSAQADGTTVVNVKEAGSGRRKVEVRTGVTGDGYVEVTPIGSGVLNAGDQVIVGAKGGTS